MEENSFNIFKILSKDDKELIHSAFLKFLLEEDDKIWEDVFEYSNAIKNIVLEKAYIVGEGTEKKRFRIDLVATGQKGERIIVENKFKSFPYRKQLEDYNDEFYKPTDEKYLLSFDSELIDFDLLGWKPIGYKDILIHLKKNVIEKKNVYPEDKFLFIEHYYKFLKNQFDEYGKLKLNCKPYFDKLNDKSLSTVDGKENKFWLNIIYSLIRMDLDKKFNNEREKVKFIISPGNTTAPLLNILPTEWRFDNKKMEFLIQFQGDKIKFYVHKIGDKNKGDIDYGSLNRIKKYAQEYTSINKNFKFKETYTKKHNSFYIFQIRLFQIFSDRNKLDFFEISNYLYNLIEDVNRNIIGKENN
jgi:hypothetical protein